MATSWNGFRPQNELVMLYWQALEVSQSERFRLLKAFAAAATSRPEPDPEEEETEAPARVGFIPLS